MQDFSAEDESDERFRIVRWIPHVPVIALVFLLGIFLIWAEVL